jgi:signal transduction histidine kinase
VRSPGPAPPAGPEPDGLAAAVLALTGGIELPALLDRLVDGAVALVDARSGALAVRGPDGTIERFIVGAVAAPGRLPEGLDVLGRLDDQRRPILLHRPADHPGPCGLPPDHPDLDTALGVPIRARDDLLGTLYLIGKRGGGDFTAADGRLVQALAAAAGVAIENVRLSEADRRRRHWADVFAEIRAAMLSGSDSERALLMIASGARELTGGDAVLLLLPDPAAPHEQLVVVVADGKDAAELRGLRTPVGGSIAGRVYRDGLPLSIADVADPGSHEPAFDDHGGYGPAMFAPLGGPSELGVLVVARLAGTSALSAEETALVVDFAGQAALALRMEEALRVQRNVLLLADRERIGRDLHDQVIQRLFATGMGLESITRQVTAPPLQARLRRAVDDLDQTVRDIRHAIFELQEPVDLPQTLRQQIIAVVEAAMGTSALSLEVRLADSVDAAVPPEVSTHALAVLREAVTNVVRHARAGTLSVSVTAVDRLRIEVVDDGVGLSDGGRRSGLANLAERAKRLGGTLHLDGNPAGAGARLVWDVPLPAPAPSAAWPA